MITLRNENCPICESGNRLLLGKPGKISDAFKNYNEIDEVNVVRCLDCTSKYIHPMMYFSEEFRKKLYNLDYWNSNGALEDSKNIGEKISIMAAVKKLSQDMRGKTMLDIGCGTGEFLKAGADVGFNVTGIDVDTTTTEYVVKRYGFHTVTGLLGPETFAQGSFDAVVLSHVIEHLQKPVELLAIIYSILKPNGLFVMCTPNSDSLLEDIHNVYGRVRYDRSKSYYLAPFQLPYHIIGFNLKSARRILEHSGFAVEYCKLRSGLEWEDKRRKLIMRSIKLMGALLGKGMSIVTISRKPEAARGMSNRAPGREWES
jgi:2-polyprenyl-3-methyl-5-hydroxy-6-metoxy-1,4-benzoquinol methylase